MTICTVDYILLQQIYKQLVITNVHVWLIITTLPLSYTSRTPTVFSEEIIKTHYCTV